jgi:hypothetical protein
MEPTDDENVGGVAKLEARMPELHLDATLRAKRQLGHSLGVSAPRESKGKRLVDGLIRLSDKSAVEYQDARRSLLLFLRNGNPDHYHRAQDHFESCVQSLHRAINYLERLRSLGYRLSTGAALVPRPRDLELLRDDTKRSVRAFRDFLEHIENDIIQDTVPLDRPAELHLGWQRATVNDATLEYADVVRWCVQLHQLVTPLAVVSVTVGPHPSDSDVSTDA